MTPILSILGCLWIIQDLRAVTIYVFFGWSSVALLWYLLYGRHHADARPGRGGRRPRHDDRGRLHPDGRGKAVLHLAAMLARSPATTWSCARWSPVWHPSPARVDAEYRAYLQRTANEALEEARAPAGRHPGALRGPRRALGAGRPARGGRGARRRLIVAGSCSTGGLGT